MPKTDETLNNLTETIARLRDEDGCPWDREQTPDSLKPYLLEELYETMEAIDDRDPDHVREELGDLLYLIVFYSRLYEEMGAFTLDDVITGITEKLVRRHPHVFGSEKNLSRDELRKKWQTIKDSEKKNRI